MSLIDYVLDFLTARRMTIAEESMLPSLRPGDRVAFSARPLRKEAIRRGDIVMVRAPDVSDRIDVKRVVGLPDETVKVSGAVVSIDGQPLDEPYLASWATSRNRIWVDDNYPPVEWKLGPDQYVVLSDNRVHPGAVDSRRYGPASRSQIIGKMVRRF